MNKNYLYERIYNDILQKISNDYYRAGDFLPSEKKLCEEFDVSLITVRKALSELESEKLINKVKGKGSMVNQSVRNSRKIPKSKNIGFLDIPFLSQIKQTYPPLKIDTSLLSQSNWKYSIYSAFYETLKDDYNIILMTYTKDQILNDFDKTMLRDIQRVFLIGGYDSEILKYLTEKGVFCVVYNNFDRDQAVCSVSNNDREKYCTVTETLIENGHRIIGAINGDISMSESVERAMGYQAALVKKQLFADSSLLKWGNMTIESGYWLMKDLLDTQPNMTAVVCVNDNVAAGAIQAILDKGLRCPEDISVIGHDNNEFIDRYFPVKISTIDPHYFEIGKKIALKIIRPIWIDDNTIIDSEIILRDSSRPIK